MFSKLKIFSCTIIFPVDLSVWLECSFVAYIIFLQETHSGLKLAAKEHATHSWVQIKRNGVQVSNSVVL